MQFNCFRLCAGVLFSSFCLGLFSSSQCLADKQTLDVEWIDGAWNENSSLLGRQLAAHMDANDNILLTDVKSLPPADKKNGWAHRRAINFLYLKSENYSSEYPLRYKIPVPKGTNSDGSAVRQAISVKLSGSFLIAATSSKIGWRERIASMMGDGYRSSNQRITLFDYGSKFDATPKITFDTGYKRIAALDVAASANGRVWIAAQEQVGPIRLISPIDSGGYVESDDFVGLRAGAIEATETGVFFFGAGYVNQKWVLSIWEAQKNAETTRPIFRSPGRPVHASGFVPHIVKSHNNRSAGVIYFVQYYKLDHRLNGRFEGSQDVRVFTVPRDSNVVETKFELPRIALEVRHYDRLVVFPLNSKALLLAGVSVTPEPSLMSPSSDVPLMLWRLEQGGAEVPLPINISESPCIGKGFSPNTSWISELIYSVHGETMLIVTHERDRDTCIDIGRLRQSQVNSLRSARPL